MSTVVFKNIQTDSNAMVKVIEIFIINADLRVDLQQIIFTIYGCLNPLLPCDYGFTIMLTSN